MSQITTVDMLSSYMDQEFSTRQEDTAQIILDGVEGQLARLCRRPITIGDYSEDYFVDDMYKPNFALTADPFTDIGFNMSGAPVAGIQDADTIVAYGAYMLSLRQSPVVSINCAHVVNVGSGNETPRLIVNGVDYSLHRWGMFVTGVTGGDVIHVEYTAGLDSDVYAELKLLILRASAREMILQTDDVLGIKDLETFSRHVVIPVPGFNQEEKDYIRETLKRRKLA